VQINAGIVKGITENIANFCPEVSKCRRAVIFSFFPFGLLLQIVILSFELDFFMETLCMFSSFCCRLASP
jgi:hypothetical protein